MPRPKDSPEAMSLSPPRARRTGCLWRGVAVCALMALLVIGVRACGNRIWGGRAVSLPELSRLSGVDFPASATLLASRCTDNLPQPMLCAVVWLGGTDMEQWMAAFTRREEWRSGPEYDQEATSIMLTDPMLTQYSGLLVGKRAVVFHQELPEGKQLLSCRDVVVVPADGMVFVSAGS